MEENPYKRYKKTTTIRCSVKRPVFMRDPRILVMHKSNDPTPKMLVVAERHYP
jgi:hypothetical protein